ncbi:MAG TPA: PA4780 family RIO1-like protein kinase [Cellvibrionaceae bacterium]
MKIPKRLLPLVDDGLIDEVLFQLMSGKEAEVYVVRCAGQTRCAKVYKEARKRSFKQAVQYQEGRTMRNSRRARAMAKGTRFGQKEQESSWLNAEVEALYRLAAAEVRVPKPHGFVDGVLLMDLIVDESGDPAPRLDEVGFDADTARDYHNRMMDEIVRMLCAGLVHGDLSEFNVLIDADGPVVIDLPQAVNAAGNNNAQMMLTRDVNKMRDYFGQYDRSLRVTHYAEEIWDLYERGDLYPGVKLTGEFEGNNIDADIATMMQIIEFAKEEEEDRQERKRAADDGEFS